MALLLLVQSMFVFPARAQRIYGADYASRVTWVEVPDPTAPAATTTPAPRGAVQSQVAQAQVAQASSVLLAAVAGPTSATGTGSFAATSLKPSDSWQVSAQTGDFSWSLPFGTPPAPAGPSPSLSLSYDSQAVDGETGSTNNQPSAVGDGWSLSGGGFIERTYVPCSLDTPAPVTTSGDECWSNDNATISFAGHSGKLVKDTATGTWKLQSDDGSRIEHLVGAAAGCGSTNGTYDDDCWRVTTTDGTQYYFGLNTLPGYGLAKPRRTRLGRCRSMATTPANRVTGRPSRPQAACRPGGGTSTTSFNVHNNAEALYYTTQTNKYSQNGLATAATTYVRGGDLTEIDYGIAAAAPYAANAASDKVLLAYSAPLASPDDGASD